MATRKLKWAEMNDWSKMDARPGYEMQAKFDESPIFPVVLADNKDASVNRNDAIMSEASESLSQQAPIIEDDLSFTKVEKESAMTCKVEAKTRCDSLQGGRRDDDDSSSLMINRLRREITDGSSVLQWLSEAQSCDVTNDTSNYIVVNEVY